MLAGLIEVNIRRAHQKGRAPNRPGPGVALSARAGDRPPRGSLAGPPTFVAGLARRVNAPQDARSIELAETRRPDRRGGRWRNPPRPSGRRGTASVHGARTGRIGRRNRVATSPEQSRDGGSAASTASLRADEDPDCRRRARRAATASAARRGVPCLGILSGRHGQDHRCRQDQGDHPRIPSSPSSRHRRQA